MSKIVIIGDIHGRDSWKKIQLEEDADYFVFMGDYFDSFDKLLWQQIENFREIIEFKKNNIDKCILLFGNHDAHYIEALNEKYSGYQEFGKWDIQEVLYPNLQYLQICFKMDGFLFTHAGVTNTWLKSAGIDPKTLDIDIAINELFNKDIKPFRFTRGDNDDDYGDDITQSPIWVRPESLFKDRYFDIDEAIFQVVGHTVSNIQLHKAAIWLTDALKFGQYLSIWDRHPLIYNI